MCSSASPCSGATATSPARSSRAASSSSSRSRERCSRGPRLLLLDEPTLGLAPLIVDQVFEMLQELHGEGVTILLVEQNAARTIEVADRTYVHAHAAAGSSSTGTREELAEMRRLRDRVHRHGDGRRRMTFMANSSQYVDRLDRVRQPVRADGALARAALQRHGPDELRLRRADHGRRLHDVLHARLGLAAR